MSVGRSDYSRGRQPALTNQVDPARARRYRSFIYGRSDTRVGTRLRQSNVRSVRVTMPNGRTTHTVVDGDGIPLPEVDTFLNTYLHAVDSSPNTIEAYSRHLALFFRWLDIRGASWEQIDFEAFYMFASDLRDGTLPSLRRVGVYRPQSSRARTTCEAVIAAIYTFLGYWQLESRGPTDIRLYRDDGPNHRKKHSFLAHVEADFSAQRRLRIRGPKSAPFRIINFEADFEKLLANAYSIRDKLLLSAMFDGGLRISQAVGLHHEDVFLAEKQVRVRRRVSNANRALSKQRNEFLVDMPPRFFTLYAASLVNEQLALDIDSDYVFVNLRQADRGRPMSASNGRDIVESIGTRAGVALTPHTLRHTHATALAKAGWTAPQIAARLGQASASSADVYIHLAHSDIAAKYAETSFSRETM